MLVHGQEIDDKLLKAVVVVLSPMVGGCGAGSGGCCWLLLVAVGCWWLLVGVALVLVLVVLVGEVVQAEQDFAQSLVGFDRQSAGEVEDNAKKMKRMLEDGTKKNNFINPASNHAQ